MTPTEEPQPPEPLQVREITLEEWIEATQSCCGIDLPNEDPTPTPPSPQQTP